MWLALLPLEQYHTGAMDGDSLRATPVVTAFVCRRGSVLLLRRSERVGTYRGQWAGVSGYVERPPVAQARVELAEEVGLRRSDARLRGMGPPVVVADARAARSWLIFPFLFQLRPGATIRTDWETAHTRWVRPEEVGDHKTVPGLSRALWRAWPPWGADRFWEEMEAVATDAVTGATDLALRALRAVARVRGASRERGLRALASLHPSMGIFPHLAARVLQEELRPAALAREIGAATVESARRAREMLAGRKRLLTLSASRAVKEALLGWDGEIVVCESRPKREGIALARELAQSGARVTVIADAALGVHVPRCDAVIVGADAIGDGFLVNKVGTRAAVLLAKEAGVSAYAVAQTHKVSPARWPHALGRQEAADLARVSGARVDNAVFDATPLQWFSAVITERGRLTKRMLREVRRQLAGTDLLV